MKKKQTAQDIINYVMKRAIICEGTNRVANFSDIRTGQKFYVLTKYQLEKLGGGKVDD